MSTEQVPFRSTLGQAKRPSSHPLSPLTSSEITNASSLVQKLWPSNIDLQFKILTLQEPEKTQVLPYLNAEHRGAKTPTIERKVFVCYYIRKTVC